jgi:hypothetical protein
LEELNEEHNVLQKHVNDTEKQLRLAKSEAATAKRKLAKVSTKLIVIQLYDAYVPNSTKYNHQSTHIGFQGYYRQSY